MNIQAVQTAVRRASKRFHHASDMLKAAESETARRRHGRRAHNAARALKDAERLYADMALTDA